MVHHVRDGHDYWTLPGGGVGPGETFEAAAEREMMEEAGVRVLTHALAARPIMKRNTVGGAFFESKSGRQAVLANDSASEPPEKWAILKRFRVAGRDSPVLVKIREYLMDLFAYRDDAYIAAARPHFNQAGIVWLVFGAVWSGEAANAEQMAERMVLRGYEPGDFEAALQAAAQVGWIEEADVSGTYRVTKSGEELHENVERLTNEYFYHPWSVYMQEELDELYDLLTKLHVHLSAYRKPG